MSTDYLLVLDVLCSLLRVNDRRIGSAKEFPPDLCLKEIAEILGPFDETDETKAMRRAVASASA
jgi:hypothetical protein